MRDMKEEVRQRYWKILRRVVETQADANLKDMVQKGSSGDGRCTVMAENVRKR